MTSMTVMWTLLKVDFPERVKPSSWQMPRRDATLLQPSKSRCYRRGDVSSPGPGDRHCLSTGGGGLRSHTRVFLFREGKERRQEHSTVFSTRDSDSLV